MHQILFHNSNPIYVFVCFLEMSVTFDNDSCSSNNINSLVEKISEKYNTVKVVLLLDQVIPCHEAGDDNNQSDWSTLCNSTPNVDVLINLINRENKSRADS